MIEHADKGLNSPIQETLIIKESTASQGLQRGKNFK